MHNIQPYLPELFSKPGSLLYIGARPDAHSWLDELIEVGHTISILEIWFANALGLKQEYTLPVTVGDVRDTNIDTYDYVFWWHGPEHLMKDKIAPTLQKLEKRTRKLIALACPYGLYPQGSYKGNPYEEHKTTLYPDFFVNLGYEVRTDGEPDVAGGEIVAWKMI